MLSFGVDDRGFDAGLACQQPLQLTDPVLQRPGAGALFIGPCDEPLHVAFEVLGLPQTFTQSFEMIRDGGRMVAVGIAPGKTAAPVEITRLVRRELRIYEGEYYSASQLRLSEQRTTALGFFDEEIRPWEGTLQAIYACPPPG